MDGLTRAIGDAMGGSGHILVSVTSAPKISSVDEALRVMSALEQKFSDQCALGVPMPVDDLRGATAALASLKAFLAHSKESESLLRLRINALEGELHSVYDALAKVKSELSDERVRLAAVESELSDVRVRLAAVETRDTPITIREVMRKLEDALCKEAAASLTSLLNKDQRALLFNFKKFKDAAVDASLPPALQTAVPAALAAVLHARGLTTYSPFIGFLKKSGDTAAHGSRPAISSSEMNAAITAVLDSTKAAALLAALGHYYPAPANPDAPWPIK
jgi:septal ring factor EnvC (AmiA/AmiB activator)